MGKQNLFRISLAAFFSFSALMAFGLEPLPQTVPGFENNPAKVSLGQKLYFDPRLSADNSVSCNSCHNAMGNGTDNLQFSKGIKGQFGGRNAPTVLNSAFMSVQFWDGRAASLEDQAKGPMVNPVEMGMKDHAAVVEKLKKIPGYVSEFEKVFGKEGLTIDHVANAIAMYERTLVTPNSPVDRYLAGDKKALTPLAIRGMDLIQSVGCTACHSGPNYAGPVLPIGTGFYQKFPLIPDPKLEKKYGFEKDLGRFEVTKNEADKHMFRVQTWRNVSLTGPYFHNGSVKTLDEAVRIMAKTQLNKTLKKEEVTAIVAFLKGLEGELPKQKAPVLPN